MTRIKFQAQLWSRRDRNQGSQPFARELTEGEGLRLWLNRECPSCGTYTQKTNGAWRNCLACDHWVALLEGPAPVQPRMVGTSGATHTPP